MVVKQSIDWHCRYYEMIENETLPPDMIVDLVPLCMDSVRYMLGSCRIPLLHTDTLTVATNSRHVLVIRYDPRSLLG